MEAWLEHRGDTRGTLCNDGSMGCGNMSCVSSKAFMAANVKMHKAMAVNYTCDVELDFVQGMIPHHQGAVDMCAVFLASAQPDDYLEELCVNITFLQNAEIAWMSRWLTEVRPNVAGRSGASCFDDVSVSIPCVDMLPITDLCHDLGGDGLCNCDNVVDSCNASHVANGRRFDVTTVCSRTCGSCAHPPQTPHEIVDELLQQMNGHMDSNHNTDMEHMHDMNQTDINKSHTEMVSTTAHSHMDHGVEGTHSEAGSTTDSVSGHTMPLSTTPLSISTATTLSVTNAPAPDLSNAISHAPVRLSGGFFALLLVLLVA